jgi:hypothetical protein
MTEEGRQKLNAFIDRMQSLAHWVNSTSLWIHHLIVLSEVNRHQLIHSMR